MRLLHRTIAGGITALALTVSQVLSVSATARAETAAATAGSGASEIHASARNDTSPATRPRSVYDRSTSDHLHYRSPSLRADGSGQRPQVAVTAAAFPSTCQPSVNYLSLVDTCLVYTGGHIDIYDKEAPIGSVAFNVTVHSYGDITKSSFTSDVKVEQTSSWGQFTSGWIASVDMSCAPRSSGGGCPAPITLQNNTFSGILSLGPTGSFGFGDNPAKGTTDLISPAVNITMTNPLVGNPVFFNVTSLGWYCDRAIPGNNNTAGCRSADYVPIKTYYRYGEWPEFALHVRQAQSSGLIGAPKYNTYGIPVSPLTRSSDPSGNRAKACKSSYTTPAGKSCDEYPFASSNQGAGSSSGAGGPRTFSGCSIPQVGSGSGPSGYSVCMINATQNSNAGTDLGSFYIRTRTNYNSRYFVIIIDAE